MSPAVQDALINSFTEGEKAVHYFTDDPTYRKDCKETWQQQVEAGILHFGPTEFNPALAAGTSSCEGAKFKRASSARDALTEFTCMALMEEFIGTAGSTVTGLVRALKARYAEPYEHFQIIGTYHVPNQPTSAFRRQIQDVARKLEPRMRDQIEVKITHKQSNVLEFLSESHLAHFHEILSNHLQAGPMTGAKIGEIFLKESRVARKNKEKYLECRHEGPFNQHWLKALLKGRLLQFSSTRSDIEYNIHMDESHMVSLKRKGSTIQEVGGASSSTASFSSEMLQTAPWNKRGRHW